MEVNGLIAMFLYEMIFFIIIYCVFDNNCNSINNVPIKSVISFCSSGTDCFYFTFHVTPKKIIESGHITLSLNGLYFKAIHKNRQFVISPYNVICCSGIFRKKCSSTRTTSYEYGRCSRTSQLTVSKSVLTGVAMNIWLHYLIQNHMRTIEIFCSTSYETPFFCF